jgi:hypothetical protein
MTRSNAALEDRTVESLAATWNVQHAVEWPYGYGGSARAQQLANWNQQRESSAARTGTGHR